MIRDKIEIWRIAYRGRRFIKAYKILRNEAERHRDAGHIMDFRAVNQSSISMQCVGCPDLTPRRKK